MPSTTPYPAPPARAIGRISGPYLRKAPVSLPSAWRTAVSTVSGMTPEEYGQRAGANFEKNPFYEAEVARRVEVFGAIAHVFSTYESRRAPGEKPFARGINSFQLVKTAQGWKVFTILWDSEREGNPIPEKYLASPK